MINTLFFLLTLLIWSHNMWGQNPTVVRFSPSDDATTVVVGANLSLTFSEAVNVETGFINLFKQSDNSLVESVDVSSSDVIGDGTSVIDISLSDDLEVSTGYYVQIDATCFDDLEGNSYSGIVESEKWSFTTSTLKASIQKKILASDGGISDCFGWSMAISSNYAIIGSRLDDDNGGSSGSVYIFDATTGEQLYKLLPNDGLTGDQFGFSVAISGNYAVISAFGDDDNGSGSGSAYVFDLTTGNQLYKLLASDGEPADQFGFSVAVDGKYAIIGARFDDDNDYNSGSAYIFDITTGIQIHKLLASDGAYGDDFGWSVGISGNYAVVAARQDDVNEVINIGSAYIFDITTGVQLYKLLASDGSESDQFGRSVALSGNYAVVGSSYNNGSGSAYVYDITTGNQVYKLSPSDGNTGDQFGSSVAVEGDYAVVGAPYGTIDGNGSGYAYVFDLNSGNQIRKIVPFDGATSDRFGYFNIAISGNNTLIGAYNDTDNGVTSGSAYLCDFTLFEPPTAQATNVTFANTTSSEIAVSWTRGNGNRCALFMAAGNAALEQPANKKIYAANTEYGSGDVIDANWFCVYNGTGNSVTVTGLDAFSGYQARVVEFNGPEGFESYLTSINESNPDTLQNFIVWTGTADSDWALADNWSSNQAPGSGDNVVIPVTQNQPIALNIYTDHAHTNNLKIESGAILTVAEGSALTVHGDLINEGTLTLAHSNDPRWRSGSIITLGDIDNTGSMILNRTISGGLTNGSDYTWHTMGLPVESATAETYFNGDYIYTYGETDNSWENISTPSTLINRGQGYIVKTINGNKTFAFSGTFNNGTYSVDLTNATQDNSHGYNLVSNPYPSQIDLEQLTLTNVTMVYLWNPESNSYLAYQLGNGGTMPQYIEPCQGFFAFVGTGDATGNITFANAARVHSPFGGLFKSASFEKSQVALKVFSDEGEDILLIHESDVANTGYKLFSMNGNAPQLYAQENSDEYCIYNINGSPEGRSLAIGLKSDVSGKVTVEATKQTFDDYHVTLKDNKTSQVTQLSSGITIELDYSSTDPEQRFELQFESKVVTTVDDVNANNVEVSANSESIVLSFDDVFDFAIYRLNGIEVESAKDAQGDVLVAVTPGVYLVRTICNIDTRTQKVVVK